MKPSEVLRAAADKLSPPGSWIQFDYARNVERRMTEPESRDATCWCSLGVLIAAAPTDWQARLDARRYLTRAIEVSSDGENEASIIDWNDTEGREHGEVLAAFARAAELAERDGQ